jgi:integrase
MKKQWQPDRKVPGLGLAVLASGVRTYYLRYREPGGRQQTHKIGRAEVVGLTMAREEALKILADVARGKTPTTDRKRLRHGMTVAQLAARVAEKHYPKLRPSTVIGCDVLWRRHILPRIGTEKVATLTTMQVIDMLEQLPRIQANRALATLRKAMNLAEVWGERPKGTNPCRGVEGNRERKRKRYLTRDEMERLVAALDGFGLGGIRWRFAQLIRLLLLTGCRIREVMCAEWSWLEGSVLVVPAEQHKTGQDGDARRVHLSPQALEILAELRAASNSRWVIAGDGDGPMVGYWRMWAQLLRDAQITDLRVHDLRHSFASYALTKAGLSLPQIGELLGHKSPQTTARYAHLMDEAAAEATRKVAGMIGRV